MSTVVDRGMDHTTSTFWDKTKLKTRKDQIKWILANIKNKRRSWFYFDLHWNTEYAYLDGGDRDLQYIVRRIL